MASCCTPREEPPVSWPRLGLAALLASNAMVVTLAINIAALPREHWLFINICLIGVALFTLELVGGPLLRAARDRSRRRSLSFEALFLLAMAGAAGVSFHSLFQGHGPVYFEVIAILALIYALGDRAARSSRLRAIDTLRDNQIDPELFSVWRDDQPLRCPPDELRPGDRINLPAGGFVPASASVHRGHAFVRDDHYTGEFFIRAVGPGDDLGAGTLLVDSDLQIEIRALAPSPPRAMPPVHDHHWSAITAPILRWFLPTVLLIALATAITWTFVADFSTAILYALAVLLIACPCAMGFAIPLSAWAVRGQLARAGVQLVRPGSLQTLSQVTTVIFDKTGTLTYPEPATMKVLPHPDASTSTLDKAALMGMAVALEATSDHPLAHALRASPYPPVECQLSQVHVLPGRGIVGTIQRPCGARFEITIQGAPQQGGPDHLLDILVDGSPHLRLRLQEDWRPGLETTLQTLRDAGLQLLITTGDRPDRALPFRHLVDQIDSRQSPEKKANLIRALQAQGQRVLFVGDGVNDLPALEAADVSIVCHSGAPDLEGRGDLRWDGVDLGALLEARRLALLATSTLRLNLAYATCYNLLGISLAALGLLHPVSAALIMVGSSAFITWFTAIRIAASPPASRRGRAPLIPDLIRG